MANEGNLIKNSDRTPSERRENAKKAGKASGIARRKNADLKRALKVVLMLDVPDAKLRKRLENMGVETTLEQGLALSVVQKAVNRGDVKALQTICQILGENITTGDKQEQRARIQKLEAETRKINAEIERAKDRDGEKDTQVVIVDEWSEEDESKDCTDTTGD